MPAASRFSTGTFHSCVNRHAALRWSAVSCEEKDRLLRKYERATDRWIKAVTAVSKRPDASAAELTEFLLEIDKSRAAALEAKAAFVKHTTEHGCLVMTAKATSF
jgi:hypothetical protein